jgi:hypothetical protein
VSSVCRCLVSVASSSNTRRRNVVSSCMSCPEESPIPSMTSSPLTCSPFPSLQYLAVPESFPVRRQNTTFLGAAHITDTTSHTVASEIVNGLVQYDGKLNIVPDMAERWDLSPDKRTYTAICASRWLRTLRLRAMRHVWRSPIISALTLLGRGAPASGGVGSRIQL